MNSSEIIKHFQTELGESSVLTKPEDLAVYGLDWTKVFKADPLCIVFPKNTKEVSSVLKYCNDHKIPVVPSGGRTGLCGGAVAAKKEVVLSLSRMNKIENVDAVGLTIQAQAGVTTEALQIAARDAGLFFPVDLAAKGSCQVGGNIATNAGGVKLIRYGGTREQVLGVEVVLANGDVLDLNSSLRKNNSGYDLKQLFIASEGTLGVVTRCTLKLAPKQKSLQVAILATKTFDDIMNILAHCNRAGVVLTAFEFFTDVAHKIVLKRLPGARSPFSDIAPFYVLLEIEQHTDDHSEFENLLSGLFDKNLITDAVIAMNSTQFKEFWALRENITESLNAHGQVRKNDIALAIDQLGEYLKELQKILATNKSEIELVLFGHIGDGNLHINYVAPKSIPSAEFQATARAIEVDVFKLLKKFNGSISAEHGIGLTKKSDLHFTRTAQEVNWMRQIKKMFDPNGILNPGKIFD